jgi:hypothetical protein
MGAGQEPKTTSGKSHSGAGEGNNYEVSSVPVLIGLDSARGSYASGARHRNTSARTVPAYDGMRLGTRAALAREARRLSGTRMRRCVGCAGIAPRWSAAEILKRHKAAKDEPALAREPAGRGVGALRKLISGVDLSLR